MHLDETKDEVHMGLQSLDNLHQELVELYSGLLSALQFCHSFFSKSKTMRKMAAVFDSDKPGEILRRLEEQHKKVIDCGNDCKRVSSHQLEQKYLGLLGDHQTSLAHLNDQIFQILVHMDESELQLTLRRISNIPFQTHHDDISHRRTPGTCDWITGRDEFRLWMRSSSSVIILYGIRKYSNRYLASGCQSY